MSDSASPQSLMIRLWEEEQADDVSTFVSVNSTLGTAWVGTQEEFYNLFLGYEVKDPRALADLPGLMEALHLIINNPKRKRSSVPRRLSSFISIARLLELVG